jgi:hypothetical protein
MARLGSSELSTNEPGARRGISSHPVRKFFEEGGLVVFMLRARRTAVAGEANPVDHLYAHLNIAQIAHESGFGEVYQSRFPVSLWRDALRFR